MKERRNFYRILGVQPDASARVIRTAWRTWMQKLDVHPDRGGDPLVAMTLNAAYHVLRDPRRRAAYDRDLLRRWNRRELAGAGAPGARSHKVSPAMSDHPNRRNYYRVLGVQPNVPPEIIDSAFRTLAEEAEVDAELLRQAHWVVGHPARRADYDRWLGRAGHAAAAGMTAASTPCCVFCKTPHGEYPGAERLPRCWNCTAPLNRAAPCLAQDGRLYARCAADQPVVIHDSWPPREHAGRVEDLTPAGLTLTMQVPLEQSAIVRVEATGFAAVGIVIYSTGSADCWRCGLQLLTADFGQSGVVVSARC